MTNAFSKQRRSFLSKLSKLFFLFAASKTTIYVTGVFSAKKYGKLVAGAKTGSWVVQESTCRYEIACQQAGDTKGRSCRVGDIDWDCYYDTYYCEYRCE